VMTESVDNREDPLPLKVTSFYFGASPISGLRAKRNKRRAIRRAAVGALRCSGSEVYFVVPTFYVRNFHLTRKNAENSSKIVAKAAFSARCWFRNVSAATQSVTTQ
jgi:hypothetical protein